KVDYGALLRNGTVAGNIKVADGDILLIPRVDISVRLMVLGQVNTPGSFALREETDLFSALNLAGGPNQKADIGNVTVMSGGTVRHYDIDSFVRKAALDQNARVKPGDVVLVAELQNRVYVLGEVENPGAYDLARGATAIDAVTMAGGATRRAVLRSTAVIRHDGKKTARMAADMDKALNKGDLSDNMVLQNGDILFVPETGSPDWENIFKLLLNINLVKGLVD
ncbi:MAG: SLBB domain-containing protein, partial [bacterium]|nr:SLBB domain-containing protein [bacterium]